MKAISTLLGLALVLAAQASAQSTQPQNNYAQTVQILAVMDGDTIQVLQGSGGTHPFGNRVTIRLACIDAPEVKQSPWGIESSKSLAAILQNHPDVQMQVVDRDRYGRLVAEIFHDGKLVNLEMLATGHAVIYPKYLHSCAAHKQQYLQAEQQAKTNRLGFWNQSKPTMPWDFRHGKTPSPQVNSVGTNENLTQKANCSSAYPTVCIPPAPPNLNCKDIPYRKFTVLPPDPHRFDRDRDGIGCEK